MPPVFFVWISTHVTDKQREYAEYVVKEAALRFTDNNERREWAVKQIARRFQLPESLARWLVETAVTAIKHRIHL